MVLRRSPSLGATVAGAVDIPVAARLCLRSPRGLTASVSDLAPVKSVGHYAWTFYLPIDTFRVPLKVITLPLAAVHGEVSCGGSESGGI